AAAHVVITGFSQHESKNKFLFSYENPSGEPLQKKADNINPCLVDSNCSPIRKRAKPICPVPEMARICFKNIPS
ncbi:MAG: hypothetical protein R2941_25625, partial [Desulfobacterales bacterium]